MQPRGFLKPKQSCKGRDVTGMNECDPQGPSLPPINQQNKPLLAHLGLCGISCNMQQNTAFFPRITEHSKEVSDTNICMNTQKTGDDGFPKEECTMARKKMCHCCCFYWPRWFGGSGNTGSIPSSATDWLHDLRKDTSLICFPSNLFRL